MKSDTKGPKLTLSGFFNIHKPANVTSHDVVARLRRVLGVKQIGHAGTLDPAATGVLVLAVGKATRLLRFLDDDKAYRAEILLGLTTETDDIEGAEIERRDSNHLSADSVRAALATFVGAINQFPPLYSAIHISGQRLYDLARNAGGPEELAKLKADIPQRTVCVHSIDNIEIDLPVVKVTIDCSKGTYIRSIARDLGELLGVGGTLKSLIRSRSGLFKLSDSKTLEQIQELKAQGQLEQALVPINEALPLPQLVLTSEQVQKLCLGQKLALDHESLSPATDLPALKPGKKTYVLVRLNKDEQLHDVLVASLSEPAIHSDTAAESKAVSLANGSLLLAPEVVFGNASA